LIARLIADASESVVKAPLVMKFEDYTENLFDSGVKEVAGKRESALPDIQLAILFKID